MDRGWESLTLLERKVLVLVIVRVGCVAVGSLF